MDAIVLAGGRGTRLSTVVTGVPKPMAPIQGRPFLDYLLTALAKSGLFTRVVLSVGYLGEVITRHYQRHEFPFRLEFVHEDQPLGTGGGIRYAMTTAQVSDPFFVFNGDTLFDLDYVQLAANHQENGLPISLALTSVPDASRYGAVEIDGFHVRKYLEKSDEPAPGLINAGVYVLNRSCLESESRASFSFERDILPQATARGLVGATSFTGDFIDIGIPETYAAAPAFIQKFFRSS